MGSDTGKSFEYLYVLLLLSCFFLLTIIISLISVVWAKLKVLVLMIHPAVAGPSLSYLLLLFDLVRLHRGY